MSCSFQCKSLAAESGCREKAGWRIVAYRWADFARLLLSVDKIGYLSLVEDGDRLFFQLVNARHECVSTILITNKGFEAWGSVNMP